MGANAFAAADQAKTPPAEKPRPVPTEAIAPEDLDAIEAEIDQRLEELGSAPYAPVKSDPGQQAYLFSIPAPRGLIIDRHGMPLARNRSARCVALRLSKIDASDEATAVDLVNVALDANPALTEVLIRPSAERIRSHWQHRRGLPLVITSPLSEELEKELEHSMGPAFSLETIYLRDYPQGEIACHIVGHVSREAPQLDGPVVRGESLWPQVQGRSGLEQMYDELLRGSPGLVSELYAEDGSLLARRILRAPRPGLTFVTSIDIEMQKLAEAILDKKGRPGAMVAVDAEHGDVLAMASWPQFDPSEFVPSITEERYRELADHPDHPFFPRALQAVYPPGSTFKPFVALAALDQGAIDARSRVSGPPALEIAGRTFRNWNSRHEGMLDVRAALARSCNTWFYQVGIATGAEALIENMNRFGFGRAPDLPIEGTADGALPISPRGQQALANLSIGQGDVLVSPLQMAVATGGLANGDKVPWPRLILQTQTAPPEEQVVAVQSESGESMPYDSHHLNLVRGGLWSAVNGGGTAGSASMSWPQVLGKTGTAQWGPKKEGRNVAWFTGYVYANEPRIAIAVAIEGKPHMSTAGGTHAAPLAGEFLNRVYENPTRYAVTVPSRDSLRSEEASMIAAASPQPRAGRSMIQISPRPTDEDGTSSRSTGVRPLGSGSSSASPPVARPVRPSTNTSGGSSAAPSSSDPPQRGGFLSRLRSLFPSGR